MVYKITAALLSAMGILASVGCNQKEVYYTLVPIGIVGGLLEIVELSLRLLGGLVGL